MMAGTPNDSPKPSSPVLAQSDRIIHITVQSVMQGVPKIEVHVLESSLVRELKAMIADRCEVSTDKQLLLYKDKELKDDDAPIAIYGILQNCTVTLNVKMNTGVSRNSRSGASLVLYMPTRMAEDTTSLRHQIKGMSVAKPLGRRKKEKADKNTKEWTPAKEGENMLARNRMKTLMKHRKSKVNILSDTPTDAGSVIGSQMGTNCHTASMTHSPVATPPPELASGAASPSPASAADGTLTVEIKPVTEKELKLFFSPPETMKQLSLKRNEFHTPPQSQKELEELKIRLAAIEKTRCKVCRKKLPLSEQTMSCQCQMTFCQKHRDPGAHRCDIDYKQKGRTKLIKENPKVADGGVRKAKLDKN